MIKKKIFSMIYFFVSLILLMCSLIYIVIHPTNWVYYAPQAILFFIALMLAITYQMRLDMEQRNKHYNEYLNQDNAKIYHFYEKHPRVHKMKADEDSMLVYINPKLWIHITRLENGKFLISTPPYKGVKREQVNAQFRPLIKLKDLKTRIV